MSKLSNQNEILSIILAICSFIVTLEMTRLLRFEAKLEYIIKALSKCFNDLISFIIVFFIIWLAYVQLIYLIYNQNATEFRSFVQAWSWI